MNETLRETQNITKDPDETSSDRLETVSLKNVILKLHRPPSELWEEDKWTCVHIRDLTDPFIPNDPERIQDPTWFSVTTFHWLPQLRKSSRTCLSYLLSWNERDLWVSLYWLGVSIRIMIKLCLMCRRHVAKTTLSAMQHHLGDNYCIKGMTDYPNELEDEKQTPITRPRHPFWTLQPDIIITPFRLLLYRCPPALFSQHW